MATIKDIANLANVAPSTVSYVINGTKNVRPETEKRIRDAIEALKYTPNQIARSLKTNQSKIIGVILPNIGNPFFTELVESLEVQFRKEGYHIILYSTHNDPREKETSIELMMNYGIDGIILICPDTDVNLSSPHTKGIPVVSIDQKLSPPCHSVLVDNTEGGFLATDCLCNRGKSRILLITNVIKSEPFFERMVGHRKALSKHGILYDESLVFECLVNYQNGYQVMEDILDQNIEFDGIFSASYYLTMGILRSLSQHKLKIPDQIGIVSYDDPPDTAFTIPALTTIRQPLKEMGKTAARILIDELHSRHQNPSTIVIKPTLVMRETI